MTLARVLDHAGELRQPPLCMDCRACQRSGWQQDRGCGEPPVLRVRGVGRVEWNPEAFMERIEPLVSRGAVQPGHEASKRYRWADVGTVTEILGLPWDMCPAYYARIYRGPAVAVAEQAIAIAGATRRERAWSAWDTSRPLSPRLSRAVAIAERGLAYHDRAEIERDRKRKEGGGVK